MEGNKVPENWKELIPHIAAVDFDGTLVADEYPNIGRKNEELFQRLYWLREHDWKLILWTSRDGSLLDDAVKYCKQQGLTFDAINENLPELVAIFNNDTRKVYADVYIDDKAVLPKPF